MEHLSLWCYSIPCKIPIFHHFYKWISQLLSHFLFYHLVCHKHHIILYYNTLYFIKSVLYVFIISTSTSRLHVRVGVKDNENRSWNRTDTGYRTMLSSFHVVTYPSGWFSRFQWELSMSRNKIEPDRLIQIIPFY